MIWEQSLNAGNLLTGIGFLLTIAVALNGLNQWRADLTVKMIDEYSQVKYRDARYQLRKWMRELGDQDCRAAIADQYASSPERFADSLGALNGYYNRVGILLKQGALIRSLILGELRGDVALFESALIGWIEFTTKRRSADLVAVGKSTRMLRDYWRGTRLLIRRCRG